MSITIKDIAKDLKVSKTTVSFVLSGIGSSKGISAGTQKKILEYVEEKGYQPNLLAKSLYTGISNTIGVIVPSIGDIFYAELVKEFEVEAKKSGYILTICSSERDVLQEVKMIRMLRTKQVDGLIIAPTEYCGQELKSLLKENFPFVLVDRFYPDLKTNYVVVDDLETSFVLVNKLIAQGKKKIALITTDTRITTISLRNKGYKDALNEAKIPFDENLFCEVKRTNYANNIIEVLDNLLGKVPDIDGFYFTTHYLALETILYFIKKNINISQYGLACIHRNPIFETLAPSMYVARIPLDEMGREAVNILLNEMINKTGTGDKIGYEISLSNSIGS
ncbi:MAG: LacI family transcriptional regulator [Prolixibacteraceae bacterium]|nr:LacI family transcriptional regulator [Prolixibacteraceae bacterium]